MTFPAKLDFSAKYIQCGTCGALGLSDQGICDESDIGQACTAGEQMLGRGTGTRKTDLELDAKSCLIINPEGSIEDP